MKHSLDSTAGDALLDELVLLGSLEGDGVHAVAAADVAGVQPVNLQALGRGVLPAEEVVVVHAARVPEGGVPHT
jgi:hypothetical protein